MSKSPGQQVSAVLKEQKAKAVLFFRPFTKKSIVPNMSMAKWEIVPTIGMYPEALKKLAFKTVDLG
ncbi:hypothetical protein PHSC3_000457 [Chlamydiales bacterium STE3]|nr:hypothetical protein PHSC3_000457 [Chlamydiales bacterium STE3]